MKSDPGSVPMNDPLAFLLTWTTYGSWLPGDERGWAEKPGRFREPDSSRAMSARQRMTEPEVTLGCEQRRIVEGTIADHCQIRRWHLHACCCRTQHVHVVVSAANRKPDDVMDQFKAWCTRRLKEHAASRLKPDAQAKNSLNLCDKAGSIAMETPAAAVTAAVSGIRQNWWTQRGSKRQLYNQESLEAAIRYVLEGQRDSE